MNSVFPTASNRLSLNRVEVELIDTGVENEVGYVVRCRLGTVLNAQMILDALSEMLLYQFNGLTPSLKDGNEN